MGEIIEIRKFMRTCDNCRWQGPKNKNGLIERCMRPGGWNLDMKSGKCADFVRKEECQ